MPHAQWTAVEALAQAFSTFTMGRPSSPFADRATCPRMLCWKEWYPHPELENHAASMSRIPSPQSANASLRASPVSSLMPFSRYLPNFIIPVPMI